MIHISHEENKFTTCSCFYQLQFKQTANQISESFTAALLAYCIKLETLLPPSPANCTNHPLVFYTLKAPALAGSTRRGVRLNDLIMASKC